jgi:hypothetical protein
VATIVQLPGGNCSALYTTSDRNRRNYPRPGATSRLKRNSWARRPVRTESSQGMPFVIAAGCTAVYSVWSTSLLRIRCAASGSAPTSILGSNCSPPISTLTALSSGLPTTLPEFAPKAGCNCQNAFAKAASPQINATKAGLQTATAALVTCAYFIFSR